MGRCILAVDDDSIMREIYARVLGEAGFEVLMARNGTEALKTLEIETPDLVLLDIEMPGTTGWEVLETMRSRVAMRDIPVILVTGLVEPSAAERASRPRYDCYLTKKTTGKELLMLVEQVLAGGLAPALGEAPAWDGS
jgi:CheY-like chemotaxis protein